MDQEAVNAADFDLKIPKEVLEFLYSMAMRLEIAEGGTYLHMPYWIEIRNREEAQVRFHNLDHLPKELYDALSELRGGPEKGEDNNLPVIEDEITDVIFEDDETTRESSTDTAGEPSGEK